MTETPSANGRYWHVELREDPAQRTAALLPLKQYVQAAHRDARHRLDALASVSLDPLAQEPRRSASFGYPWMLDSLTLQGYLGEVFAGLIAERFGAVGERTWEVPAFLFRFHDYAFDALERWHQGGRSPGRMPGRPGNDCVAFEKQTSGEVSRILVCEAKCTLDHDASLIKDAHVALSDAAARSVSILKLVEILKDRGDATSLDWISALVRFFHSPDEKERCDLVVYLCGRSPVRNPLTWIAVAQANKSYTAGRRLEAAEVHLVNVAALVGQLYQQQSDWDGNVP